MTEKGLETRFVTVKQRDFFYDDVRNKRYVTGVRYFITDKKGEIPDIHFINEKDMITIYKLLTSQHMVFAKKYKYKGDD